MWNEGMHPPLHTQAKEVQIPIKYETVELF
jgi:hypothetical protein